MQQIRVETVQDQPGTIRFLEDRLYEHNSERIDQRDGQLFCKVVRDHGGSITAGISGWTWAGACEITQLWVSPNDRHRGVGSRLLGEAEEEARRKGCRTILAKTYSFQAPSFYEKHGYRVEHVIESFPAGHRYYTFIKRMADPG